MNLISFSFAYFQFDSVLNTIQTKVIDRQEKAVVVSQFTSVLKLFENHLTNHRIKYLVLTGATKIAHRQNIVQSFNEEPDEQVCFQIITEIDIIISSLHITLKQRIHFSY